MQAHAAHPCLRDTELHCRGVPHALLQPAKPPRYRAPGRKARRNTAQPSTRNQQHAPRYLRLQHHCWRVADREDTPKLSAAGKYRTMKIFFDLWSFSEEALKMAEACESRTHQSQQS